MPAEIRRDDGGFWTALIAGEPKGEPLADPDAHEDLLRIWHYGRRSDQPEHAYLVAIINWARTHQTGHPLLHPYQAVDLATLPPPMVPA